MAEYIECEALLELVEHLDKYERCKNCYHLSSCDAWVRHGTTLYDDYGYSVKNCPYYIHIADVVEVVRCRYCKYHHWEQEPCHGKTEHFCSVLDAQVFADFYCYHGKPKMDGKGEGE